MNVTENNSGKGKVYWGKSLKEVLDLQNISEDFKGVFMPNSVRYIHRQLPDKYIYFVANSADSKQTINCTFPTHSKCLELWDAVTGTIRPLTQWKLNTNGTTTLMLEFEPRQSWFIVFKQNEPKQVSNTVDFPKSKAVSVINGSWDVYFNPSSGGPGKVKFESLMDWSLRSEEGIKFYSGTATYKKQFQLKKECLGGKLYLDLGVVKNIAEVRLNGKTIGTIWCAPWRVEISKVAKSGNNQLEIEVVNLWPNRMIGDERQFPDDCTILKQELMGRHWLQYLIG